MTKEEVEREYMDQYVTLHYNCEPWTITGTIRHYGCIETKTGFPEYHPEHIKWIERR